MAKQKEFPGFPRFYKKGDLTQVANTPTDAVNLEHRGFKASEDVKVEEAKVEAPVAVETPKPTGRPVRDNPQA